MTKNNPIEKLEKVDNHFKTAKFHSFNEVEELEEQGGVYCVYKDNQAVTMNPLSKINWNNAAKASKTIELTRSIVINPPLNK